MISRFASRSFPLARFLNRSGVILARRFSTSTGQEQVAPLLQSKYPAVKALGTRCASGLCPHCGSRKAASGTAFDCPGCGFPTHCCEDHHKHDFQHAELCSILRTHNADVNDLSEKKPREELKFPEWNKKCDLTGWKEYFESRGMAHVVENPRAMRYLTAQTTYTLTIASFLDQAIAAKFGPNATAERFIRIVILGARAECTVPIVFWKELLRQYPSANFSIQYVGPGVSEDRSGDSVYVMPALRLSYQRFLYEEVHEQLKEHENGPDTLHLYVGFNSGLGQEGSTWDKTLEIIFDEGNPLLLTSYSESDFSADLKKLKSWNHHAHTLAQWSAPGPNPFASLKPDVDCLHHARVVFPSKFAVGVWNPPKDKK